MTRQWLVRGEFGRQNLVLDQTDPPPPPGPGEATVHWSAWSINYRDMLMIEGQYDPRLPLPFVPLSDAAGVVEAVGDGASVSVGDRVIPLFSPAWADGPPDRRALRETRGGRVSGAAATHQTLPAAELMPIPASLSIPEAATVPCAAVTAYRALVEHGELAAGQRVLVLGSGGVAVWAARIAKALGAQLLMTTSTDEKAARLREELGADEVVRYTEDPRWGRTARKWADDEGVDVVVEVGGAGTLANSLDAVRPGGTVAVIGVVAGGKSELSVLPILMKEIRAQGVFVGSRATTQATLALIEAHDLHPPIGETFGFDALPQALDRMESGQHFGKIVLTNA